VAATAGGDGVAATAAWLWLWRGCGGMSWDLRRYDGISWNLIRTVIRFLENDYVYIHI
jgi:hypothetical protein